MAPRRGSFWWVIATPATRVYLILGLASLMIYFLVIGSRAGDLGSMLIVAVAMPGLFAGWVVSPALFILLSTYLLIDPNFDGVLSLFRTPFFGGRRGAVTPLFSFEDVLLATSGLGFLLAHYRLQSLAFRGLPFEPRIKRKGEKDEEPVRPVSLVGETELGIGMILTVSATIVGQFAFWILIQVERNAAISRYALVQTVIGRLMLFLFVLGIVTCVSGFVFTYLRWRKMNRLEAEIILQDEVWSETRREHERILHWQKWHLQKEAQAQKGKLR
jgi:hypothetical protein